MQLYGMWRVLSDNYKAEVSAAKRAKAIVDVEHNAWTSSLGPSWG
jgi:hypothetical protein